MTDAAFAALSIEDRARYWASIGNVSMCNANLRILGLLATPELIEELRLLAAPAGVEGERIG